MLAATANDLSASDEPISVVDVRGIRLSENIVQVTHVTIWRGSMSQRSSL